VLGRRSDRTRLGLVNELAHAMGQASICGLGQVAANPMAMVLKHFPEELNKYLAAGAAPSMPPKRG